MSHVSLYLLRKVARVCCQQVVSRSQLECDIGYDLSESEMRMERSQRVSHHGSVHTK